MEIRFANAQDIDGWMELVEQVRDVFPGLETAGALEDHRATVLHFMKSACAVCAVESGSIAGGLLFSRDAAALCFLAVAPSHRRRHIAQEMVSFMLAQLGADRDVTVTTYREGDPRGTAARAFYKRLGFREGKLAEEFGCPVQEFVLKRPGLVPFSANVYHSNEAIPDRNSAI